MTTLIKILFHLAFCCCTGKFLLELSTFLCISNETSQIVSVKGKTYSNLKRSNWRQSSVQRLIYMQPTSPTCSSGCMGLLAGGGKAGLCFAEGNQCFNFYRMKPQWNPKEVCCAVPAEDNLRNKGLQCNAMPSDTCVSSGCLQTTDITL